jgi:hypothetical protein
VGQLNAGALPEAELEATVVAAGFEGFEVYWRGDRFDGAARPRREVRHFGTHGISFRATKPES